MSISQAREAGGRMFREQWGPSLLSVLLAIAAFIVASVAVIGVGGLIVLGPVNVGLLYVYYQAAQGKKIVYTDMLCGFKTNFGEIVLGALLKQAFFIGVIVAAYLLTTPLAALLVFLRTPLIMIISSVIIGAAAVVALIFFGLYLAPVEYILMREPDAKGWEAVKKSKRIMEGNKGKLFGFTMSFIGWFILTAIFLPLAVYTVPYYFMARTIFIGSIYEEEERRAKQAPAAIPNPVPAPAPVRAQEMVPAPAPEQAAAPAPAQTQAAAPAPVSDEFKFCKYCGEKLAADMAFCSECGKPQE